MSEIQINRHMDQALITTEAGRNWADRAVAHAAPKELLRHAQRWQDPHVTDEAVARVFLALEYYRTRPYRNVNGRWYVPAGTAPAGTNTNLSPVIGEMVRTGLLRHWRDRDGDHLIPAPVHFLDRTVTGPGLVVVHSACLFVGEDMGPMRARLVERMDLTDCLACEQAIATGKPRAL